MKDLKSITTLILLTVSAFVYSQELGSDFLNTLPGKWSWVSYSGGFGGLPPTPANSYYNMEFGTAGSGLPDTSFFCNGYDDTTLLFSRQLLITRDTLDTLLQYRLHPDVLNLLFGFSDTVSVDVRIISDDSIEFTHKNVADDFSYLFVRKCCELKVKAGRSDIFGGPVPWDQIAHQLNSVIKHRWVCGGQGFPGGLVLAVIDSTGCSTWKSRDVDIGIDPLTGNYYNTIHKNVHCKSRDIDGFDFPTFGAGTVVTSQFQQRIVDFINSVPDGNYILAYSVNQAYYEFWSQDLVNAFTSLGSTLVASLTAYSNKPWIFFAKKGEPGTTMEVTIAPSVDSVSFNTSFNCIELNIDTTATRINSKNMEDEFVIYPNPANDFIQMNYGTDIQKITLMNAMGQQIHEILTPSPQPIIYLNSVQPGIYLLRIETSQCILIRKVVKS